MSDSLSPNPSEPGARKPAQAPVVPVDDARPSEPAAPDPTRYGDWEKNGRCIDF